MYAHTCIYTYVYVYIYVYTHISNHTERKNFFNTFPLSLASIAHDRFSKTH